MVPENSRISLRLDIEMSSWKKHVKKRKVIAGTAPEAVERGVERATEKKAELFKYS